MKEHVVEVAGLVTGCAEDGSGTPLVLLHGFPFDRSMWAAQAEALAGGCRVLNVDLRGFGDSQLAQGDATEGVSMRDYADGVIGLLDQLGVDEPAVFAGFSMGGYVLWQIALCFSERVKGLAAVDTRSAADTDAAREVRLSMASQITATGERPDLSGMRGKLLAPATISDRPEVIGRVELMMNRVAPPAIAAAQRGMAARPDVGDYLGGMDVPALVLCGEHDVISTPEEMRGIAEALPDAEYVEVAGAGHLTPIEQPEAVSEALRRLMERAG